MKHCRQCGVDKPEIEFHVNKARKDGLAAYCKPCCCARASEWSRTHVERRKLIASRHYEANKDAYKQRAASWSKTNRIRRREIVNAYDRRDIEGTRARKRACASVRYHRDLQVSRQRGKEHAKLFRSRHPERVTRWIREAARKAFERDPQRYRMLTRERAARRRALIHWSNTGRRVDYGSICERDGMVCHICRLLVLAADLEFDHVIPLAKGGPHTEENIAVAHAFCNRSKGARIPALQENLIIEEV